MRPILLLTVLSVAAAAGGCSSDVTGTGYQSDQLNASTDRSSAGRGEDKEHESRNRSRTVPFKAHYDARIVSVGPGPGCDGRLYLEGEGKGNLLGRFTITLGFCGRADGTLDTGTGTFVAANGDLLYITFHGVSDGGHPVLHFTSYITFAGGTGRFEGATGTATVNGIFDAATGAGPADWRGRITFREERIGTTNYAACCPLFAKRHSKPIDRAVTASLAESGQRRAGSGQQRSQQTGDRHRTELTSFGGHRPPLLMTRIAPVRPLPVPPPSIARTKRISFTLFAGMRRSSAIPPKRTPFRYTSRSLSGPRSIFEIRNVGRKRSSAW